MKEVTRDRLLENKETHGKKAGSRSWVLFPACLIFPSNVSTNFREFWSGTRSAKAIFG